MVELSEPTRDRIQRVFAPAHWEEAEWVLAYSCADNLPLMALADPESLERVRFAVIKLSGGDIEELGRWVVEAQRDWRDVLVDAGFGERLGAHLEWNP